VLSRQDGGHKQSRVDRCVEALCNHGCERVAIYIQRLRASEVFVEVDKLDERERCQLLRELESIMAPYDERKSAE